MLCVVTEPIRGQYPGHVITIDQSEASIQMLSVVTEMSRAGLQLYSDIRSPYAALSLCHHMASTLQPRSVMCPMSRAATLLSVCLLAQENNVNYTGSCHTDDGQKKEMRIV